MRIEILTFDGCPNADSAIEHVRQAIRMESADATVEIISVDTPEAADALRFLGSPSVRVNGEDVERPAQDEQSFGLMCRRYDCKGSVMGSPSVALIRAAIRSHVT